jgi:hypothetical protein
MTIGTCAWLSGVKMADAAKQTMAIFIVPGSVRLKLYAAKILQERKVDVRLGTVCERSAMDAWFGPTEPRS